MDSPSLPSLIKGASNKVVSERESLVRIFLAGGIAGSVSRTLVAPLTVIKR